MHQHLENCPLQTTLQRFALLHKSKRRGTNHEEVESRVCLGFPEFLSEAASGDWGEQDKEPHTPQAPGLEKMSCQVQVGPTSPPSQAYTFNS